METWFVVIISLCIAFLLKSIFSLLWSSPASDSNSNSNSNSNSSTNSKKKLPPGPFTVPVIGNLLGLIWLIRSFRKIEPILRTLRLKYGPLITLRSGSRPVIVVASHSQAHQALVQNGAVFSDRPKAVATSKIVNSNRHNISSAAYGPTWRVLRRNLTSEILHPSRVKSYSHARRLVLGVLVRRLAVSESSSATVKVVDHLQYAMFCLLVLMCFGDKLDENQIKQIERVQRRMLLNFVRLNLLNFWPRLGKIVFRNRWKELIQMRQDQEAVLIPLIKSRIEFIKQQQDDNDNDSVVAYVDTLVDLRLPEEEENRKLTEGEIVTLCSEFLNAGTDTTSTALQWIMANLVKHPQIQAKLYQEISAAVGPAEHVVVEEEDLQKMPYLKAVVLESLRRHPPGHFLLPHLVTEDVELDGYVVPKNARVFFMVAELGWDPKVWSDPMEFKPERFLYNEGFDLTGSKEIKMMPFGAGRRICPGLALALLHLEYFVANLVWYFEWTAADGDEVDLSEKQEFTTVMKNPLRAHISPRHPHPF